MSDKPDLVKETEAAEKEYLDFFSNEESKYDDKELLREAIGSLLVDYLADEISIKDAKTIRNCIFKLITEPDRYLNKETPTL